MTFKLEQLVKQTTRKEVFDTLKELLKDIGYDETIFSPGSPAADFIMMGAELGVTGSEQARALTSGSLMDLSTGNFLTQNSDSNFDNDRVEAVFAQGTFYISSSKPISWQPSEVHVTDGSHVFVNDSDISLVSGSAGGETVTHPYSATGSFTATVAGSSHNIPNNTSLSFDPDVNYAVVNNYPLSGTTSWLTTAGVDEEKDRTLRERNRLKWATLGSTSANFIKSKLITSGVGVTKVAIDDNNPRGPFTADFAVAGDLTTVGASEISRLQGIISSSVIFGVSGSNPWLVKDAEFIELNMTGTVYFKSTANAAVVQEAVEQALTTFLEDTPMGGYDFTPSGSNIVSRAQLIETVIGLEPVRTFDLVSPHEDIVLPVSGVLTPGTFGALTYTKLVNI